MKTNDKIIIPLSKGKVIFLLIASIIAVIICLTILSNPQRFDRYPTLFITVVASIGVVFFGLATYIGLRKLFDKKPGLVIDKEGLIEHTNATSVGRIPWEDIQGFETIKVASTHFILVYVKNPDFYIDECKKFMKRRLLKANFKSYGTPLSIATSVLKKKRVEVEKLLQMAWEQYK